MELRRKNFNPLTNLEVIEEELYRAKRALFQVNSVKKVKFLQRKIEYLEKLKEKIEKKNF